MNAVIVSDLHLGSHYFCYQEFEHFLKSIPQDFELILNGDIIDNPKAQLTPPHQSILHLIKRRSYAQRIVWVQGNHDKGFVTNGLGKVNFKSFYSIGNRLLIVHGYDFDDIMPRNQGFIKAFRLMHNVRIRLGAKPVHVAEYAKKWKRLYKVLRKNVMMNAVNYARENGFQTVVCGHTHYPEDRVHNGIRYINTGAWTEFPAFYLQVNGSAMSLQSTETPLDTHG